MAAFLLLRALARRLWRCSREATVVTITVGVDVDSPPGYRCDIRSASIPTSEVGLMHTHPL